jgi:hypothetical protein
MTAKPFLKPRCNGGIGCPKCDEIYRKANEKS